MEKSAHGVSLTRHALVSGGEDDPATIQHWLREAQRRGWIPRWLSVFGGPGDRRYAVVLDPNPEGVLWNVDGLWGEDAGGYQQRFEAQASQWAWPSLVTVTPDGRGFASVFRDGDMGAWVARHNMGSADYQREVEAWWPKGYFPLYVQAGGSGADARFACLFVQGAKLIVVPAAFTVPTGMAHWEVLLRARAIETGCYVAAAAQVGPYPAGAGKEQRACWGHSMIVDPWGKVLAQVTDRPGFATARLDLGYLERVREMIPVHRHRVLKG
jgi:hypothetical protein